VRAATPSAAAEIITEGAFASRQFVSEAAEHLRYLVMRRIADERENLMQLAQRLARVHPRRRLQDQAQHLDDLQSTLLRCIRFGIRAHRSGIGALCQRLLRLQPSFKLLRHRKELERLQCSLGERARMYFTSARTRLETASTRLRLLSPLNVLERGYSMTLDAATGKVIHSSDETESGQRLKTRLRSGEIISVVEEDQDRDG
jgi:exodeoxyribonuclease VII large subunit